MTNTSRKLAALALAAPAIATLGLSGTAAANAYEADADCVGLVVDMPRAEDGTTVTAYRNGIVERSVYVATFGDPVRWTPNSRDGIVPSPDQSVRQSWRVVVTGHNGTSSWSEVVAPCVAPSTSSTAPATTTTTVPSTTSTVAVSAPPVPSTTAPAAATTTTTVQPPRATTTTVAAQPTTFTLPETGPSALDVLALIALCAAAVGAFLAQTARRPR